MGPLVVVEIEVGINPLPSFGNRLVMHEINVLIFHCSPQALNKYVVHATSPTIHADENAVILEHPVKILLVNWEPWSVLNIPGFPKWRAFSNAFWQNDVSRDVDICQEMTYRLHQSMMATRYMKPL